MGDSLVSAMAERPPRALGLSPRMSPVDPVEAAASSTRFRPMCTLLCAPATEIRTESSPKIFCDFDPLRPPCVPRPSHAMDSPTIFCVTANSRLKALNERRTLLHNYAQCQ